MKDILNNEIISKAEFSFDHLNGIIYDFKFGKAVMSQAQYSKYFNNFGLPIQIIRP